MPIRLTVWKSMSSCYRRGKTLRRRKGCLKKLLALQIFIGGLYDDRSMAITGCSDAHGSLRGRGISVIIINANNRHDISIAFSEHNTLK